MAKGPKLPPIKRGVKEDKKPPSEKSAQVGSHAPAHARGVSTGPKGIPNAVVIKALEKNAAIITHAAAELGIDDEGLRRRIYGKKMPDGSYSDGDPELRNAIRIIKGRMLDLAEGKAVKLLQKGDGQTVRWYLERLGRERGYGNHLEVETRITGRDIANLVAAFGAGSAGLRSLADALETPQLPGPPEDD